MMVEGLKGEKGREMSYTTEDKYIPSFEEMCKEVILFSTINRFLTL